MRLVCHDSWHSQSLLCAASWYWSCQPARTGTVSPAAAFSIAARKAFFAPLPRWLNSSWLIQQPWNKCLNMRQMVLLPEPMRPATTSRSCLGFCSFTVKADCSSSRPISGTCSWLKGALAATRVTCTGRTAAPSWQGTTCIWTGTGELCTTKLGARCKVTPLTDGCDLMSSVKVPERWSCTGAGAIGIATTGGPVVAARWRGSTAVGPLVEARCRAGANLTADTGTPVPHAARPVASFGSPLAWCGLHAGTICACGASLHVPRRTSGAVCRGRSSWRVVGGTCAGGCPDTSPALSALAPVRGRIALCVTRADSSKVAVRDRASDAKGGRSQVAVRLPSSNVWEAMINHASMAE